MAAAKSKSKTRRGMSKTSRAAASKVSDLSSALAQAAWAEADAALATALADLDEATGARGAAREEAMAMLAQSLARAARKRGLARIGALGAAETFHPERHELTRAVAKPPKIVRIEARGVARGDDVLVKPRAGPVRRKKRP